MTAQLDLFTDNTPTQTATPKPHRPLNAPATQADVQASLLAHLTITVPLHMAEIRDWTPQQRRRWGLPPGWTALIGMADAMLYGSKIRGRTELAYNLYTRGLAVLAYQPEGVNLFSHHWCATHHARCPNSQPTLIGPAWNSLTAACQAALRTPEWHAALDRVEQAWAGEQQAAA